MARLSTRSQYSFFRRVRAFFSSCAARSRLYASMSSPIFGGFFSSRASSLSKEAILLRTKLSLSSSLRLPSPYKADSVSCSVMPSKSSALDGRAGSAVGTVPTWPCTGCPCAAASVPCGGSVPLSGAGTACPSASTAASGTGSAACSSVPSVSNACTAEPDSPDERNRASFRRIAPLAPCPSSKMLNPPFRLP